VSVFKSPWLRHQDLPKFFRNQGLSGRCVRAEWLAPFHQGNRCTLYRLVDAIACVILIDHEIFPPLVKEESCISRNISKSLIDKDSLFQHMNTALVHEYGFRLRAKDLGGFLNSPGLAFRCQRSGMIIPQIKTHKGTHFEIDDLLKCVELMESGDFPPNRSALITSHIHASGLVGACNIIDSD
jgi:hypothetical protein